MNKDITLRQILELMKQIKDNDYNDEYEVFFDSGRPIVQSKIMEVTTWK